jgi:hypothetical protein
MSRTHTTTQTVRLTATLVITIALGLAAAGVAVAADSLAEIRNHPGFVALEDLDLFGPDGAQTDVDLRGPMMRMVAAATASSDPELSAALAGILRIRVLASEDVEDPAVARSAIVRAGEQLEAEGWMRMVRVAEDDELVLVLARENGDHFAGLTVLMADDEEISLVNLVGDIDPATIGRLAADLDALPDLDELTSLREGDGT